MVSFKNKNLSSSIMLQMDGPTNKNMWVIQNLHSKLFFILKIEHKLIWVVVEVLAVRNCVM